MKRTFLLISIALVLSGCARQLHSPPARISPLELAQPLEERETSAGVHAGLRGAIFGPEIGSLTARVRHGWTESVEAGVDLNVARVISPLAADQEVPLAQYDRNIYAARASMKWAPSDLGRYVSVIGGLGGGFHEAGGFVSPDIGLVTSYDWYITPFASFSGWVSQPINAQTLDLREELEDEPLLETPEFNYGYTFAAGISVPLGPVDIMTAISIDHLIDDDEELLMTGLNAGWRFRF